MMKAVMRLREVLATPKMISLDSDEVRQAVKFCEKHWQEAERISQPTPKTVLLHLPRGTGGCYFLFRPDTGSVLYFVQYEAVALARHLAPKQADPVKACRQVLVWRLGEDPATAGVASDVFWQHLWPKYQVLVSDTQQTVQGRSFWQYAIRHAIAHRHRVQIVNTNDWTRTPIDTLGDLDETAVWGPSDWFRRKVIVISHKEFQ